jgi:DNA polymerase
MMYGAWTTILESTNMDILSMADASSILLLERRRFILYTRRSNGEEGMNLITLDFETYFDADYTLSKMTTESYVRDPRFKVHCVGFQYDEIAEVWDDTPVSTEVDIQEGGLVCHHAHFDGLILSHHYDIKPAFWFDTLSMARLVFPHAKSHSLGSLAKMLGLQEKTVPYESFKGIRDLPPDLYTRVAEGCANDVELTYAIFKALLPHVPKNELRLIDLTIRLFTEPALRLDRDKLAAYLRDSAVSKTDMLEAIGATKESLNSSARFATLLTNLGVDPPTKISKTTGKETFAFARTDSVLKELQEHDDVRVQALVGARLGIKSNMVETRAQRLLDMDRRGAMCVYLKYYGAHTGRWAGGDKMNWQNFKRGVLREAILAPAGCVLVVGDLSQIECRILNWLAGQGDVLEAFRTGRDLYSEGATRFYGRTITKQDKVERHLGKTLELGCGYGMGPEKFKITCKAGALGGPSIELTDDEAKQAVHSYRESHRHVKALWKRADQWLRNLYEPGDISVEGPLNIQNQRIYFAGGSWSDYTHLGYDGKDFYTESPRTGRVKMYGAKLVENVVQALARVVIGEALLKVAGRYKVVLTTHDEIVCAAPAGEADEALEFVLNTLRTPPDWLAGCPLDAEGGYAANYSK